MISEILGIVNSVLGMFNSNSAHDQSDANLERIKKSQVVSDSARQAASIYGSLANTGLLGYETMKSDISNQLPTTLDEAKDYLTPGNVVDFLSRAKAQTDAQLRSLNMADSQQRLENTNRYAAFLGGPMAQQENDVLRNQSMLGIAQNDNMMNKRSLQNDYMGQAAGYVGMLGDTDWSKIVALLSGDKNTSNLDPQWVNQPRNVNPEFESSVKWTY